MSELSERVDLAANFYNQSFLNFDYQLADFSFRTLKPYFHGKLALELGPSSGYMTRSLVKEFEQLHLVEGAKSLLDQIPDYPNVVKNHSLFEDFETTERYDTIVMSHVLEHICTPLQILTKIRSWLRDDGVFLVSVPNARSLHRMVAVEMGLLANEYQLNQRDKDLGHYRVYDLDSLRKDVVDAGFKVRHSGGYFLKPLSNAQIEQNWNQQMIDGFYKLGAHFQQNCAEIFVVCSK